WPHGDNRVGAAPDERGEANAGPAARNGSYTEGSGISGRPLSQDERSIRPVPKPRAQPDRQTIQSTANVSALLGVSVGSRVGVMLLPLVLFGSILLWRDRSL